MILPPIKLQPSLFNSMKLFFNNKPLPKITFLKKFIYLEVIPNDNCKICMDF